MAGFHTRTTCAVPLTCGPRCEGLHPPTNRGEPYDPNNHESVTCAAVEAGMSRMTYVKGGMLDMDPGVEAGNPTGLFQPIDPAVTLPDDSVVDRMPIYSVLDDAGNIIELYYHDPITGVKITSTGFTAATPQVGNESEEVFDTLTSGVVERITKHTTYTDGVPTALTYTEIDSIAAYVPAGTIATKPQKVQMASTAASLDITVTGAAGTGLGLTGIANSKGQMFPQHVLVHIHVDSADNAAGIAYTTDGSVPTETHEFERSEGQPIELDSWEEANNFLAVPLDANGDLAPTESIQITIEPNNIDVDKDDV